MSKNSLDGTERAKGNLRIKHRLDLFLIALSYHTFVKHPMASSDYSGGYPTHDADGRPILYLPLRDKVFDRLNVHPTLLRKRLIKSKHNTKFFLLMAASCYELSKIS